MLLNNTRIGRLPMLLMSALLLFSVTMFTSCSEDEEQMLATMSFDYKMHMGQAVPSAPYIGTHPSGLSAVMKLDELANGNTTITITLNNTVNGETYNVHAHDAADASSTPNNTPYNESPNADVFVQSMMGNGGTITLTQEANMSISDLTSNYAGFFVVHDPLQAINTQNISSYVIVGGFAREQANFSVFQYAFNTGQVASAFAYSGAHPTSLAASLTVVEKSGAECDIVVKVMNSVNGEVYNVHAHDMADPATTPNGTPYSEAPNANVLVAALDGNGGTVTHTNVANMSYSDITSTYDAFFVIHDPMQTVSTVDPTTYVVLGAFAR